MRCRLLFLYTVVLLSAEAVNTDFGVALIDRHMEKVIERSALIF